MLKRFTAGLLLGALATTPGQAQDKPATGAGIVLSSDAAPPPPSPSSRLVAQAIRVADHLEPAIPRPEQEKAAAEKLAAFERRTGRKPNILLLLVDDMGWGDAGAFGGGEAVGGATPNIDTLAAGGLKLTSTYSQPTCTPTRSAIITGRLPVRTGLIRPLMATEKMPVNPWQGEHSLPALLSQVGYRTALSGKWHVGEAEGMLPHEVGFDEFLGIGSVQAYLTATLPRRTMVVPEIVNDPARVRDYAEGGGIFALIRASKGQGRNFTRVKPLDTAEAVAELDQEAARFSIDFMKKAAADKKPFFLEHSFVKVHYDNLPAKGFTGTSVAKTHYRDAIVEVDHIVGRLVAALREAGELENTFIFFTSDNGPELGGYPDQGTTPFRSGKGTTWEGGVRVPGIAAWKGVIKPGQASNGMFDLMDFHMTALALAGALDKQPTDNYVDGIDQSSFLLADGGQTKRHATYFWLGTDFSAVRVAEFKIYLKPLVHQVPMSGSGAAMVVQSGTSPWTFNLNVDPQEQKIGANYQYELVFDAANGEVQRHLATFKKYPFKDLGLGVGK